MVADLRTMIYVVLVVLVSAIAIIVWRLTKPRRELALPNETDYGTWLIRLPNGLEEGHLQPAGQTIARDFETAIANCTDTTRKTHLQSIRDEIMKFHLFAFKGSGNCLIQTNCNLLDEKLSEPLEEKRILVTPETLIDKGEHGGFHLVYLHMPDPNKIGIKPPERQKLDELLDGLKYIKSTALNLGTQNQMQEKIDALEGTNEVLLKETAQLRSERDEARVAAGIKPLTTEEAPEAKGTFRARLEEYLEGWRLISTFASGYGMYVVWKATKWFGVDPLYPAVVLGVAVYLFVYPIIHKRL